MYSSPADLGKLGIAILRNAQLSAKETREWLKPATHTNSLYLSVGRPWEIYRFVADDSANHVVDAYTKSGDLGDYHTWFILLPDYNVALSIMVAGADTTQSVLRQTIMAPLLPALFATARQQAAENLAGTYNSTTIKSSATFTADEGPGLALTSLISNGTDLLTVIGELGGTDAANGPVRVYPTTLFAKGSSANKNVVQRTGYRLAFQGLVPNPALLPALGACDTWGGVDSAVYGNVGVDEMVIGVDKNGRGLEVELRGLRVVLERT